MKRTGTKAIVIHTTASNDFTTFAQIQNFFLNALGWSRGGYNVVIARNGKAHHPHDWKSELSFGIAAENGFSNANVINIAYIGGIKNYSANEAVNNITPQQEAEMISQIKEMLKWYPNATIIGHNQIGRRNLKYCPSFWVPDFLKKHGVAEKHIDQRDPNLIKKTILSLPHPPGFYKKNSEVCEACGKKIIE